MILAIIAKPSNPYVVLVDNIYLASKINCKDLPINNTGRFNHLNQCQCNRRPCFCFLNNDNKDK